MSHTQAIEKNIEYLPVIYLTQSMKHLFQQGKQLTEKQSPSILITGESGTGKELLAKSIHYTTAPNAPFITINCLNLPFDHFQEKIQQCFSVFSDYTSNCSELSAASKSTLFLRDIGKLDAQVKLSILDFLKKEMLDTSSPERKHTRLFFSCNPNGEEPDIPEVFDSRTLDEFKPFMLSILPLRNRSDDIQPLATFFLDKFSKEYGKDIGGIHGNALKLLETYHWPGNVSELRDVMENAVLLAQNPLILKDDIRFNISKKSIALESFLSREDFFTLEELERIYIQTVLRRVKNNKSKAAKILGMSRNTLQRRIDSYDSSPPKNKTRKKNRNQPALF